MTKKDFEAIAAAIANAKDMSDVRINIASYCAQTNPRFDTAKFLAACNGTCTNSFPTLKYDTKVKPANIIEGREHYEGQVGHVSAPSPADGEHVMVFWPELGVSSVWAIRDLVKVGKNK